MTTDRPGASTPSSRGIPGSGSHPPTAASPDSPGTPHRSGTTPERQRTSRDSRPRPSAIPETPPESTALRWRTLFDNCPLYREGTGPRRCLEHATKSMLIDGISVPKVLVTQPCWSYMRWRDTDRKGSLMRSKSLALSFAVLVLGATGCGGSSSPGSGPKPGLSAARGTGPIRIYRLALAGSAETPVGAPSGVGVAVIAFHGSSVVCWRFAHLHGFTNATFAHIHRGPKGRSGNIVVPLSIGPALHHQGCVSVIRALVKAIEHNPRGYYVNIHSAKYPGGAVRAQL
jgi:hypothetical protein